MPIPILYSTAMSPPCRAVLLAAGAAGIELDVQETNTFAKEHLKEEFVKMNPQHTVPTLDDNGFVLWDSHAIISYLVSKYGKNDSLYPKDLQKRAIIDQRLHFDSGVLFSHLRDICYPLFHRGETEIPEDKLAFVDEAYGFLEKFLEAQDWLAGDSYTLADLSCVSTVSSLTALLPIDKYPNLSAWLKRCEEKIPGYAKWNAPGAEGFHKAIRETVKNL